MSNGCRVRVSGPFWPRMWMGSATSWPLRVTPCRSGTGTCGCWRRSAVGWPGGVCRLTELTPEGLEDFLDGRRREGYHHALSMRAVMPLMGYLRGVGAAPGPLVAPASGALEVVVEDYRRYLLSERALTPTVAGKYTRLARAFLTEAVHAGAGLSELSAAVVTGYVVRECRGRPAGSAKHLVTGLRSVLGFLFLAGHINEPLALAVPSVAHWGAGSLPRALSPDTVIALAASCDSAHPGWAA